LLPPATSLSHDGSRATGKALPLMQQNLEEIGYGPWLANQSKSKILPSPITKQFHYPGEIIQ